MEGLLEIAYVNTKKLNASTSGSHLKMAKLVFDAQNDDTVKVILFHGGPYFSAGNDVSVLGKFVAKDFGEEEKWKALAHGTQHAMV